LTISTDQTRRAIVIVLPCYGALEFVIVIIYIIIINVQIRPFKNAHMSRSSDLELQHLSRYLKHIARKPDISQLNHRHWER